MDTKIYTLSDEMPFGKYRGIALEDICANSPDYIFWMDRHDVLKLAPEIIKSAASFAERDKERRRAWRETKAKERSDMEADELVQKSRHMDDNNWLEIDEAYSIGCGDFGS